MQGTHNNLWAHALAPEQHNRTCGYWYTVTSDHMAHTAFRTRAALMSWLEVRGLSLSEPLPTEQGTWQSQRIVGGYRQGSGWDTTAFWALQGVRFASYNNGTPRPHIAVTDSDGIVTVHNLNPNVEQPAYPWREVNAVQDAGDLYPATEPRPCVECGRTD